MVEQRKEDTDLEIDDPTIVKAAEVPPVKKPSRRSKPNSRQKPPLPVPVLTPTASVGGEAATDEASAEGPAAVPVVEKRESQMISYDWVNIL